MPAKNIANKPSATITIKIDLTTDDVTCRPSDSAEPCTANPSTEAIRPIAPLPRRDDAETEWIRRLQPREKSLRTDAAIAPGDAHSTEQSGDIGEERQERQADDQRREPR